MSQIHYSIYLLYFSMVNEFRWIAVETVRMQLIVTFVQSKTFCLKGIRVG